MSHKRSKCWLLSLVLAACSTDKGAGPLPDAGSDERTADHGTAVDTATPDGATIADTTTDNTAPWYDTARPELAIIDAESLPDSAVGDMEVIAADRVGDAISDEKTADIDMVMPDENARETAADVADGGGTTPVCDPTGPVAAQTFGPLEPWAEPITDYLDAGFASVGSWAFLRGIHDLTLYQNRLYLGYGDANVNLGRVIPIEFRAFTDPQTPTVQSEFASDEEQLERYRRLGPDLYMAGVDATEDAWLGNIYYRGVDLGWVKSRTLQEGVHVHDVATWQDNLYAVGSGATPDEWNAGDIYAHLWQSDDGGASFAIAAREHNGGQGDCRWVRMLPSGDDLYLFGYKTDNNGSIYELVNRFWDGSATAPLPAWHDLVYVFVTETDALDASLGLVRGVDASAEPLLNRIWRVKPQNDVIDLTFFHGQTVVDVDVYPATGEVLFLTVDGDDYQAQASATAWDVHIYTSTDLEAFTELLAFHTEVPPRSLAYWQCNLYLGTDWGAVLRAAQQTAAP